MKSKINGHEYYTLAWTLRPKGGFTEIMEKELCEWLRVKKWCYAYKYGIEYKGGAETRHLHMGLLTSYKPNDKRKNQFEVHSELKKNLQQRWMVDGEFDCWGVAFEGKTWYKGGDKNDWNDYMVKDEGEIVYYGLESDEDFAPYLQEDIPMEGRNQHRVISPWLCKIAELFKEHELPYDTIRSVDIGMAKLTYKMKLIDAYDLKHHMMKCQQLWMHMNEYEGSINELMMTSALSMKKARQNEMKKRKIQEVDSRSIKRIKPSDEMVNYRNNFVSNDDLGGL